MIEQFVSMLVYIISAILVVILYAAAVTGTGWIFVRIGTHVSGHSSPMPRLVTVLTCFSMGLGIYAGIWIFISLGGWLHPSGVFACLVPGLVAVAAAARHAFGNIFNCVLRHRDIPTWDALELFLGLILGLLAVAAFGPPIGDAVAFYMAWAKVIAASGALAPLPGYELFSNIWIVGEMHFAAIMTWGGEPAAKFFIWFVVLASVGWIWELSARCGLERRGRLLAVCIVLTSTAFGFLSWDGKTDLVAVPPALGAIWWALSPRSSGKALWVVMIGSLAGTAVAAKLSYLPPLGAALMVLIFRHYLASEPPTRRWAFRSLGDAAAIGLAAVLILLPQFIKNYVLFAQPLAPILIFHDGHVACCGYANDVWYSPPVVQRIILTFPFAVSFGTYWAQYGVLSPLMIGFLPFALLWRPDSGEPFNQLRWMTLAAVVGMIAWLVVAPSQMAPRYFLAPILLFAILAAWLGQTASREAPRILRPIFPFMAIASAIVVMPWLYQHASEALRYTWREVAIAPPESPIEEKRVADVVNAQARQGDRILLVSYYRYFLRPDLLQCLASGPYLDLQDSRAVQELDLSGVGSGNFVQLKRVDALIAGRLGLDFILQEKARDPDFSVDPTVAKPIYEDTRWTVYRVIIPDESGAAKEPRRHCRPVGNGHWTVKTSQVSGMQASGI
jgi:hypothetical protein